MSTQRIAKLAAAATASGFMTVGIIAGTTGTAHADQNIDVDHVYNCVVTAGALNLGTKVIGVNTTATLPDTYTAGGTIPTRKVDITLTLPEDLRAQTYGFVGGRSADGGSTNTDLFLVNSGINSGAETPVRLQNLKSLAPVNIPENVGDPWTVPAQGDQPPITIPSTATGDTTVLMPKKFLINATIYREKDGGTGSGTVPSTLDCTISTDTPAYRFVATVPQEGAVNPVATDVNVSTDYATAVGVTLSATDPNGDTLTYATEEPANGTLSGTGTNLTYTPDDNFAGTDTFDYTATDPDGNVGTGTVTVEVDKATSKTKVSAPKRSKAGKPVKMTVTVNSEATAAGKVTAKLGKKTVATGKVKNGKAVLTVAGKATKKLKGKKVFTVTYAGSAVVEGSSAKATVTFTR